MAHTILQGSKYMLGFISINSPPKFGKTYLFFSIHPTRDQIYDMQYNI